VTTTGEISYRVVLQWRIKANYYTIQRVRVRKRVLLIAASIVAARKLVNRYGRPSPALESAIADAITIAERIMARIDRVAC